MCAMKNQSMISHVTVRCVSVVISTNYVVDLTIANEYYQYIPNSIQHHRSQAIACICELNNATSTRLEGL